jgi:2-oxoisovalerate dehydrogenase E1 component alpha subunit
MKQAEFKAPPLTPELKLQMHDRMVCSRIVDEVTIKMNRAGQGFFWIGGPGEEAFGASLGMQVQKGQGPDYDYLHLHYRSNPILMAMGADPIDTLRQMRGSQLDPYSGGRNFVNHYSIPAWNVCPVTPTIETQYVMAPGTAWVQKRHGGTGISIVNGGDAGTAEGDFASCLNWSTIPGRELPLLIIINHNKFGISTASETIQSSPNLAQRAEPYGIRWAVVDGNDVFASWNAIAEAMHYCRTERKPYCIQANVSRLHGHSSASGANRVEEEDPITRFEAHLIEEGLLTRAGCDEVWEKWRTQLNEAHKQVLQEPLASDRDAFIFKEA